MVSPVIVVFFGPSGAGKTTAAIERYPIEEIVSPDQYRYRDGGYHHDGSGTPIRRCRAEARRRLAGGVERVVIDTAATTPRHLNSWEALAYEFGARLVWIGVTTREPVTLQRNIHGTPPAKLDAMWRDMEDTLSRWSRPVPVQVLTD
jgi:predicted kinase